MKFHRSPRFVILFISLVLIPPAGAEGGPEAFAPATAAYHVADNMVQMAWIPGIDMADEFRVYGIIGGGATLLETTTSFSTSVASGFDFYAVAGVKGEFESVPVYAFSTECTVEVDTEVFPPEAKLTGTCPWSPPTGYVTARVSDLGII